MSSLKVSGKSDDELRFYQFWKNQPGKSISIMHVYFNYNNFINSQYSNFQHFDFLKKMNPKVQK